MAFEDIERGAGNTKKASEMEKGDEIIAYMLGVKETNGKFGEQHNLLMQDAETGEEFLLYTAGTLKYDAKDGRIKPGLLTRIECLGEEKRVSKTGSRYTTRVFRVQQDKEDTIDVDAPETNSASDIKERAAAVRNKRLGK